MRECKHPFGILKYAGFLGKFPISPQHLLKPMYVVCEDCGEQIIPIPPTVIDHYDRMVLREQFGVSLSDLLGETGHVFAAASGSLAGLRILFQEKRLGNLLGGVVYGSYPLKDGEGLVPVVKPADPKYLDLYPFNKWEKKDAKT